MATGRSRLREWSYTCVAVGEQWIENLFGYGYCLSERVVIDKAKPTYHQSDSELPHSRMFHPEVSDDGDSFAGCQRGPVESNETGDSRAWCYVDQVMLYVE